MNPIYSVKQFRLLISQIKLEREDKRIKLTLPYNPTYIKKIKTIPGYYWHPDKKYWSFPYSEDILKKKALCTIVFLYKHVLNKNEYVPNLFTLKMSICGNKKGF